MSLGNFSSKVSSFQKCHNDFQPLLEILHCFCIFLVFTLNLIKCNSTYRDPLQVNWKFLHSVSGGLQADCGQTAGLHNVAVIGRTRWWLMVAVVETHQGWLVNTDCTDCTDTPQAPQPPRPTYRRGRDRGRDRGGAVTSLPGWPDWHSTGRGRLRAPHRSRSRCSRGGRGEEGEEGWGPGLWWWWREVRRRGSSIRWSRWHWADRRWRSRRSGCLGLRCSERWLGLVGLSAEAGAPSGRRLGAGAGAR